MHRESTHSYDCGREEDAPTVFRHAYFRSVWSLRSSSDPKLADGKAVYVEDNYMSVI